MSILVSASASPPAGSLREMLEQYVAMRRRLGYKFQHQGRMLTAFVEYLEQRRETTITVASAMAWVTAPEGASICYQRQRLSAVRGFAHHLAAFDPACQVPPARLLPAAPAPVPYLYSPQEISALIHAAGTLAARLRPTTIWLPQRCTRTIAADSGAGSASAGASAARRGCRGARWRAVSRTSPSGTGPRSCWSGCAATGAAGAGGLAAGHREGRTAEGEVASGV